LAGTTRDLWLAPTSVEDLQGNEMLGRLISEGGLKMR